MTNAMPLMILVLLTIIVFRETCGYGKMINPLSRNSLWRKNFPSKVNQADGDLNCGGPVIQYDKNHGECGECGDDYSLSRPRSHENGGIYGKGMISRAYMKGSIINVTVELLGGHHGQFDFDICPLNRNMLETNVCFQQYRLPLADGSGYGFNVSKTYEQLRKVIVSLKLPWKLTCRHCVLRWQFRSVDKYFEEIGIKMPTGYRATWRNCADIAILKVRSVRSFMKENTPN